MSPTRTWITAAVLVASTSVSASEPSYRLAWKPTVGETHTYRLTVRFDYTIGTVDFNSDLTLKVLNVNPQGGYRLQVLTKNATEKVGEESQALDEQPPSEQTFAANGTPLDEDVKEKNNDSFQDLLNHLTTFQGPPRAMKIGETWQNRPSGPKNTFMGTPWITYRLAEIVKTGNVSYAKITYTARKGADPEAATGTLLLNRVNNALYRLEVSILHFRPEGAASEATVNVMLQEK